MEADITITDQAGRKVFSVDTGDLPVDQAQLYLEEFKKKYCQS